MVSTTISDLVFTGYMSLSLKRLVNSVPGFQSSNLLMSVATVSEPVESSFRPARNFERCAQGGAGDSLRLLFADCGGSNRYEFEPLGAFDVSLRSRSWPPVVG